MILVDTNIILDLFEKEPQWSEWSADQLNKHQAEGLAINPMIYAELSPSSRSRKELDSHLAPFGFKFLEISKDGLFRAAEAFVCYRKNKGPRDSLLPDFFIGAHASVLGATIMTRDARRYRSYFPEVSLITPDSE